MEEACASSGLPAGCERTEFGCTERPSLGSALINIAGILTHVLYIIGVIVIAVV
jgi:hypothetical protein